MLRPPRYVEAYPGIAATDALRNWRRGRTAFLWRREGGQVVGAADIEWVSTSLVRLRFAWRGRPYLAGVAADVRVEVVYARSGGRSRAMFLCPGCAEQAAKLNLVEEGFRCRRCHGMRNRSSTLSPKKRAAEDLYRIESMIGHGRPPRMTNKMYHSLLDKKREILRLFPRLPALSSQGPFIISGPEWLSRGWTVEF